MYIFGVFVSLYKSMFVYGSAAVLPGSFVLLSLYTLVMLVHSFEVCYLHNTSLPKHVSVSDFIYVTYTSHVCLWESPGSRLHLSPHPSHSDGQTAARGSAVRKAPLNSLSLFSISAFVNNLAPINSGRKAGLYILVYPIEFSKVPWSPANVFTKSLMGNRLIGR